MNSKQKKHCNPGKLPTHITEDMVLSVFTQEAMTHTSDEVVKLTGLKIGPVRSALKFWETEGLLTKEHFAGGVAVWKNNRTSVPIVRVKWDASLADRFAA